MLHRSTVSSLVALQPGHSKLHTSYGVRTAWGSARMSHMSRLQVGQDGRSKASPGLDVYGLVRDGRNSLHSKSSTRDIAAASRFLIDRPDGMFSICSHVNRRPWRGLFARLAGTGSVRLGLREGAERVRECVQQFATIKQLLTATELSTS